MERFKAKKSNCIDCRKIYKQTQAKQNRCHDCRRKQTLKENRLKYNYAKNKKRQEQKRLAELMAMHPVFVAVPKPRVFIPSPLVSPRAGDTPLVNEVRRIYPPLAKTIPVLSLNGRLCLN